MSVATSPETVLELAEVTKSYAAEPPVMALAGVSFTVDRSELVAIVGPSGSGKSTLLHLMGTLDRPSSGTVRLTGLDVAGLSDRELAALPRPGLVPEVAEQLVHLPAHPGEVREGVALAAHCQTA